MLCKKIVLIALLTAFVIPLGVAGTITGRVPVRVCDSVPVSVSETVPVPEPCPAAATMPGAALNIDSTVQVADSIVKPLRFYQKGLLGKVYNYFANSNSKVRKRNFDISFIGGPHYSTEEGFGIGLAASGIYSAGGLADTITPLSNKTLKADVTTGQMYKIGLEGYHIFVNDRYRLNYDVYFYSFRDKFWGLGYEMASNDANMSWYKRLQSQAKVDFVFQIAKDVFLGPKGEFSYINARDFDNINLLEGQKDRTFTMGVGATFIIDTRDIPTCAQRGVNLRLDLIANPGFLANKYSFSFFELNLSGYKRVWKGGVLAGNLHTRNTFGNTPWGLLSTFGGSHNMRGYWEGRYRDKMETDVTLELRQNVYRRNGLAVWVGAGTIYPKFSQFRLKHILPNGGIGYRWEFKRGVNVRLDVGFGKGEKSFNFSLNEAF